MKVDIRMGFLDNLTKNPSLIALAALGIGLFIFRDKISSFFSGISGGAETVSNLGETGNILSSNLLGNLTGIQDIFKGISDFEFPTFELPSFELPTFELPTLGENVVGTGDITETPAAIGRASDRGRIVDVIKSFVPEMAILENLNVQSEIEGQQFQGGGVSFIGGVVRETPITGESTLGFITDKLGISASEAASIRGELQGFTPDEETFLTQKSFFANEFGGGVEVFRARESLPQTSGGFEGLTPEEIALRLTGGTITNF